MGMNHKTFLLMFKLKKHRGPHTWKRLSMKVEIANQWDWACVKCGRAEYSYTGSNPRGRAEKDEFIGAGTREDIEAR